MARGADSSSEAGTSSDESDTTAPAPAPAPAPAAAAANGEDANPTKEAKCVEAISTIATEFLCPITRELPMEPVLAEDGRV